MPAGGRLLSIGRGGTRRLAGFDDGGNHPENRRVAVRFLVGDEEGDDEEGEHLEEDAS